MSVAAPRIPRGVVFLFASVARSSLDLISPDNSVESGVQVYCAADRRAGARPR